MPEIKSHGKLFFDKIIPADCLHPISLLTEKIVSRSDNSPAQMKAGERTCRCGQ